ncbi:hypothetical protein BDC45DRAFT_442189 [Circinella umbellata]|nr:hypothetical protein BDC45DRAFT_442189 [Circinella umbellata]
MWQQVEQNQQSGSIVLILSLRCYLTTLGLKFYVAVNQPKLGVVPIMWMPMSNKKRNRCIQ